MTLILIVDDEPQIRRLVQTGLEGYGYDTVAAATGERALALTAQRNPDLVILDIALGSEPNGIEVCRRIREWSQVPVIMLSVREDERAKVTALDAGADDYVTKPFSMAELVSRVRSILRRRELDRAESTTAGVRELGGIRVDLVRHLVEVDGRPVHLTLSEFKVLALLAAEPERVFTRRQVMEHLWQSPYVGDERACDVHVSNLRRKIERSPAEPERIVTVRGVGYKLVPV